MCRWYVGNVINSCDLLTGLEQSGLDNDSVGATQEV